MTQILKSVLGTLYSIPMGAIQDIRDSFFFPKYKFVPKAECQKKVKGQNAIIRSLQDNVSGQASEGKEKDREISRLKTLLGETTKERDAYKKEADSLEWALRREKERNERKR